jgi:predicted secreted hydrolase
LLFDMSKQLLVRVTAAVAAIFALAQFAFVQLVAAPPTVRPSGGRTPSALTSKQFRLALPGFKHVFPRDHAAHPEYSTEWWYYTGHLESRGGRRFGL